MTVTLGIDLLLRDHLDLLHQRKVGLVSSISGVTRDLRSTMTALQAIPDVELVALFGPEHGFYGAEADGRFVPNQTDTSTRLPVHSLYGDHKKPTAAMLRGIDLLIFDIQTVGVRFYTYTTTLLYLLQAAAENGIPVIVCDRPNPIGGEIVEGPLLQPNLTSFIGCGPLPMRHGLTIGELAKLFNEVWQVNSDLTVIPCQGWRREMWYDETGLIWVPPSPGMPKLETAVCYPGTCLIEGTNLSEGRGTAVPFEQLGAPWLNGQQLADQLNTQDHAGVLFRPTHFEPTDSKYQGQMCNGIQIHVTNRALFRPVTVTLAILATIRHNHPSQFQWRLPHFDQLIGTREVRQQIETSQPIDRIVNSWQNDQKIFAEQTAHIRLYA